MNINSFRKLLLEAQSKSQTGIIMWPTSRMMLRYGDEIYVGSPAYKEAMKTIVNGELKDLTLDYEASFGSFKAFVVPVDHVLDTPSLLKKAWELCKKRGPISCYTLLPSAITDIWR